MLRFKDTSTLTAAQKAEGQLFAQQMQQAQAAQAAVIATEDKFIEALMIGLGKAGYQVYDISSLAAGFPIPGCTAVQTWTLALSNQKSIEAWQTQNSQPVTGLSAAVSAMSGGAKPGTAQYAPSSAGTIVVVKSDSPADAWGCYAAQAQNPLVLPLFFNVYGSYLLLDFSTLASSPTSDPVDAIAAAYVPAAAPVPLKLIPNLSRLIHPFLPLATAPTPAPVLPSPTLSAKHFAPWLAIGGVLFLALALRR